MRQSATMNQLITWCIYASVNFGIIPIGTNFNEIRINMLWFSFRKIYWKMSSAKCWLVQVIIQSRTVYDIYGLSHKICTRFCALFGFTTPIAKTLGSTSIRHRSHARVCVPKAIVWFTHIHLITMVWDNHPEMVSNISRDPDSWVTIESK